MRLRIKFIAAGRPDRPRFSDIVRATGIRWQTLDMLEHGQLDRVRSVYIDALCVYLECTPGQLIQADIVELPLPAGRVNNRGEEIEG